jgi:hypothetical protein
MRLAVRNARSATRFWLKATAAVLTSTVTVFVARRQKDCKPPTLAHATRRVAISSLVPSYATPTTSSPTTDEPMSSYRCSSCGESWPHEMDFRICLDCGNSCWTSNDTPMDEDDARSRLKHVKFERFCEERERKRFEQASAQIADLPETAERA